jgi:hypothetical protein
MAFPGIFTYIAERMLGSLNVYRHILNDHIFHPGQGLHAVRSEGPKLPTIGHGIAGIMAGCTVSFIAAPVEHVKARLQVQYAAEKSKRLYSGPIDCVKKLVRFSSSTTIFLYASNHVVNCSSVAMVSEVFTMDSRPLSCSALFSSSGGGLMTSSPVSSTTTPLCLCRLSISGQVACRPRYSGLRRTLPMSSSSVL